MSLLSNAYSLTSIKKSPLSSAALVNCAATWRSASLKRGLTLSSQGAIRPKLTIYSPPSKPREATPISSLPTSVKKDSLTELRDAVIKRSGKIDILINGAGVNSPTPFFEIEKEEFQHIFDINLLATMQACQVFGQYFIERGEPASIINLGSISGLNPLSRVFSYSASKAAVHNLSKNLAREWATQNIRVNTLVPGFFPAEQNRKVLDESRVASILGKTPAQRFGTPDELIGATLLLASHNAGSFITGHEMIVDGGFNAMSI